METQQIVAALNADPMNWEALDAGSSQAIATGKWNAALTLTSRMVRVRPSMDLYRRLAHTVSRLSYPLSTLIYLQAALQQNDGDEKMTADTNAEWDLLTANLLKSSTRVARLYDAIKPSLGLTSEILTQYQSIADRNDRVELVKNLLTKQGIPIGLSYYYTTDLLDSGDAAAALDVTMAALLRGDVSIHNLINITAALIAYKDIPEMVAIAQATVNLHPAHAGAWGNLGGTFDVRRRPWECITASKEALTLDPNMPSAWNNLANAYKNVGDNSAAAKAYKSALDLLDWKDKKILSNYLLMLQYTSDLTTEEKALEHWKYGDLFPEAPKLPRRGIVPGVDQLRIGFLSADFNAHSCAYFLLPLWEYLSSNGIELFAYYNANRVDQVTEQLQRNAFVWRDVENLSDADLRDLIIDDQLDVLIDPAGHTKKNRLGVFGLRAAPVQLTWLGHPNTTGVKQIDWRITDEHCDPEGSDHLYAETLYRLPIGNFGVYRPLVNRIAANRKIFKEQAPPCLSNGYITFGSCNNLAKLNDECLNLWAKVLHLVPESKLFLESAGFSQNEFRQMFLQKFSNLGIEEARVTLADRDYARQYLIYNDIDICLDPFPCNGGTTTFDLVWMGCPFVTLEGDSFVSRMGTMVAHQIGKPEWIAKCHDEYLSIAKNLASDFEALADLRMKQRQSVEQSPLMDESMFGEQFVQMLWNLTTEEEAR